MPDPHQAQAGAGSDLLSVLLNRGNKLREQMIVSSMQSKSKGEKSASSSFVPSHDVPHGVPQRKHVDTSVRFGNIYLQC